MAEWLTWTVNEFSLKNVDFEKFGINGATLCGMGKERFLDLAPDFVGDILWEHLEMLQKGKAVKIRDQDADVSDFINLSYVTRVKKESSHLTSYSNVILCWYLLL